jgi:hypothetical protein
LRLVVQEATGGIEGLHDQHAFLAFACAPEEQLEVFSYKPGEAKKFYEGFMPGFEKTPTAKFAVGLKEAPGTQVLYLRSYVGLEPTLMGAAIIALEALGGRPRDPITDEDRREYAVPITEAQLTERRRALHKQFRWASLIWLLFLPITIPLFLLLLFVSLVSMPLRLWKAWRWYEEFTAQNEHQEFLALIPDQLDFRERETSDFPALDRANLLRYTEELEALGFVHAMDYGVRTDVPTTPHGFARLFFHPVHRCVAELNQVFPETMAATTLRCMIASQMEDGWQLSTGDREPQVMTYAWRRPRALWSSHPRFRVTELLAEHLRRRQMMMERLHVAVITAMTTEAYFAFERETMAHRKAILQIKSIATIKAEMESFERSPTYEWLGDLA